MIAKNAGATGACSVFEEIINLDADALLSENSND